MNRGELHIEHKPNGTVTIFVKLADDGNVWLSKYEIADFLGVHIQSVTANLRELFRSEELLEYNVATSKEGTTFYNLDVVIALAFRCKGGYCRPIREWIRDRIKRPLVESRQPVIIQIGNSVIHS
ncbi:MAG: hypothetical protein SNI70_05320 [Rikenellaceae bacterium]